MTLLSSKMDKSALLKHINDKHTTYDMRANKKNITSQIKVTAVQCNGRQARVVNNKNEVRRQMKSVNIIM